MKHRQIWVISAIFILSDAILLYGVFRLSVAIRNIFMLQNLFAFSAHRLFNWPSVTSILQLGILLGVGVFLFQGLYPGYGLTAVKELERMSKSVTLVFFLLAGISYLNKPFQDFPRSILLIAWVLSLVILPIARFSFRNFLSRFSWYGIPVMIFGDEKRAKQVEHSLRRVRRLGWRPQEVRPTQTIEQPLQASEAQMAILAVSMNDDAEEYARSLSQSFQKVILVRTGKNSGSLWVEARDLDGNLGLEYSYHLLARESIWVKRAIDIAGSLLLLTAISPALLLLALLIRIDSRGPILFRQERLGQNFRRFFVLKFRSMSIDAEQKLEQVLREDSAARAEYEKFHKLTNDPRITRVGKWIRRFSLDEFPQLLNVLKGEMSLVGPRAYMTSELGEIGSYASIILRVKPGITGWWQVTGRHNTTFQQRLQMDEYYISNWSLWMDIYILLKTFLVVLRGGGA